MRVSRARSGVSSAHGVVVSLERNPRYACSKITHRLRTTTHASAFACNGLGAHLASRFAPSNTAKVTVGHERSFAKRPTWRAWSGRNVEVAVYIYFGFPGYIPP